MSGVGISFTQEDTISSVNNIDRRRNIERKDPNPVIDSINNRFNIEYRGRHTEK